MSCAVVFSVIHDDVHEGVFRWRIPLLYKSDFHKGILIFRLDGSLFSKTYEIE